MRLGLARPLATLLFATVMLFSARSYAQSTNATVTGQITDQSGRLVPGAAVVFTNINTGVSYTTQTNGEGIYSLPTLQPGVYRANVSKDGFKSIVKSDIELHVQDQLSINFALQVGSMSETITVEGGAPLLNTTDGSVSTVVDESYVKNMPLNGRSFQDLILLTPGSLTQTPQNSPNSQLGDTGEFSINGQRPESNYYTVDGVSANTGAAPGFFMLEWAGASGSVPAATALGTTQALVSVDDLQEFRVQSSTYSAEYGRNPGGQFSFETKSGANQWHGTAYDYLRNGVLDANDWFNDYFGVKQAALRQNDFGGTFGGPIEIPDVYNGKDKTFFFVSYEGLRLIQPQEAAVNYVPDATLRATAPAALQPVLNAFPVANGPDLGSGVAEFISGWSNPSSLNSTSVRLDHIVNQKLRLFLRFGDTPSIAKKRQTGAFATPSVDETSSYASRTYTAGASSALTPSLANDFRVNYSSNQVTSAGIVDGFGGATPVDFAELLGLGPTAEVSAVLLYGGYQIALGEPRQSATQRQWNFVDTATVSWKRHQFRFGVDYRRLTPVAIPFSPFDEYLFLSESSVESNSGLAVAASYAPAYPLYQDFSAFVQDDWRLSSRLSLSLGLRWELDPAPGETQGLKPYTVEGTGPSSWTLAPQGTSLWHTTRYNFAPRIGFAYRVRGGQGRETVVRGGVGIFYDTAQQMGSFGFEGVGFANQQIYFGAFPLSPAQVQSSLIHLWLRIALPWSDSHRTCSYPTQLSGTRQLSKPLAIPR
jgi:hypothetical protein